MRSVRACINLPRMRPLFVAGCPRSGTTSFARYLNCHPGIMITVERYNHKMPITPDLFTPERLLDFRPGETGRSEDMTRMLVETKNWGDLAWIGDKRPRYFSAYEDILERNPEARFVFVHRPLEAVAESFVERAQRSNELRWHYAFEDSVRLWNSALRRTRRFARSGAPVLVVDHRGFFFEPGAWAPVLSRFLEVDFDAEIIETWKDMGARYAKKRRAKEPLTEEQQSYVREHKGEGLESWALRRIEAQFDSILRA